MRSRIAVAAVAALLASAGVAAAGQRMVSAALQTGESTAAACYVRNVGRNPMVVHVEFLENFGSGFIAPDFDTCNTGGDGGSAVLAPGRTCVIRTSDLPDDVTFECAATAQSGSVKNLRGVAELLFVQRPGLTVAGTQELR